MGGLIDINKLESSILWGEVQLERGKAIRKNIKFLIEMEQDPMEELKLNADLSEVENTLKSLGEIYEKDKATRRILYT